MAESNPSPPSDESENIEETYAVSSMPTSGGSKISIRPYEHYHDYLRDELLRISHVVKAYLNRSRSREAEESQTHPITAIFEGVFHWHSRELNETDTNLCGKELKAASDLERIIARRLLSTPGRTAFPLVRLTSLFRLRSWNEEKQFRVSPEFDSLMVALLYYHSADYRAAISNSRTDDGSVPGMLTIGHVFEMLKPVLQVAKVAHTHWRAIGKLQQNGLIDIGSPPSFDASHRISINRVVAEYLLYSTIEDPDLRDSTRFVGPAPWEDLFADTPVLEALKAFGERAGQSMTPVILLMQDSGGAPCITAAQTLLPSLKTKLLLVADVSKGMETENFSQWVSRVYRTARLAKASVLWDRAASVLTANSNDNRWKLLMDVPNDLFVFMVSSTAWDPVDAHDVFRGTFSRIEFPIPSPETRRRIWQQQLLDLKGFSIPSEDQKVALDLLQSFHFNEGQIVDTISIARGLAACEVPLNDELSSVDVQPRHSVDLLYDACRRVSAHGLVSFTQRIPPRKNLKKLDTVVLGLEPQQLLAELNSRIIHLSEVYMRYGFGEKLNIGNGLVALFSGPSGTGKTLAATVLASSNERDLYKVDMSAVVSKYVGETEKNLAKIFSDAQSNNALLFFDEADAIFGKRGDVDKAQDRWANMEINFLLQRIEDFAGAVILATNLKQNIDEAFMRRVQVMIEFAPPDALARFQILKNMFPMDVTAPSDEELKAFTKRIDVNGGNLKNIAIDAAFRALKPQSTGAALAIELKHLVIGAAREYRKLSRTINATTFGKEYMLILEQEKIFFA